MTVETTPTTKVLVCDQHDVGALIEALETMLVVHAGTDRFTPVAMQVLPMLAELRSDR
jgi:hypothetical protein